ncbi:MAG TPA: L-serine ammonia-lyase, iron-sulfur-dependent, subunit alpha [Candidatus Limnocylindrales bacterium]|nr:L-serine ammonia-lyase, iron-sulfur-dependent, subunit alpha [Candidatus Limnocylindrales bacterium]
MKKQPPSIFNDVIGPVMRGPSSSHTAAAVRIGRIVRQFFAGNCEKYIVEFEPQGSLASTYSSQGTDLGLVGGLLGMDTADSGLLNAHETARERGLQINFRITDYAAVHPNTYRIRAFPADGKEYCFIFVSTGGGMIELREMNGNKTEIYGDFFETMLFLCETDQSILKGFREIIINEMSDIAFCLINASESAGLINIKSSTPLSDAAVSKLKDLTGFNKAVFLDPVLPTLSRKNCKVPFITAAEILNNQNTKDLPLYELALQYESARGGLDEAEVMSTGTKALAVMRGAVEEGLAGTKYTDRILGPQASQLANFRGKLIGGKLNKRVITYITAIMETKSAMGIIVAAPTAGACAGLPGTLLAVADELGLGENEAVKGLLAAGLVGVLIAARSTFAAEESGCQAECGTSSGMAAAALVQLAGGTAKQAFNAASIALQNIMGLVCDPVANRVEVPCLGKNVLAGMNALAAADMALAGFDPVIPFDETVAALDTVGRLLPAELRCTGRAGLSVTPTSLAIAEKMRNLTSGSTEPA